MPDEAAPGRGRDGRLPGGLDMEHDSAALHGQELG